MGHDFITYKDRHLHLDDMDIWTLRHFFLAEAESLSVAEANADENTLGALRDYFRSWEWVGVGVFTGADLDRFVQGNESRLELLGEFFERVIHRLQRFEGTVPLEYLKQHVNIPGARFTTSQSADRFLEAVRRLRNMLSATGDSG